MKKTLTFVIALAFASVSSQSTIAQQTYTVSDTTNSSVLDSSKGSTTLQEKQDEKVDKSTPNPVPSPKVDETAGTNTTNNSGNPISDASNGDHKAFNFGGWIQGGYSSQSTGLFNNRPDRFEFNQIWFYAERELTEERNFGFRVDTMFGTDGGDTQAFANPAGTFDFQNGLDFGGYSWAIPQAYVQLGTPDTNLKVGHFYTTIGYEAVTAPDNFFYSHAITMYNSEPFTHTGILGETKTSDDTTVYAGWTLGWDTGFAQSNGGSNFLGGFQKEFSEDFTFRYMTTVGDFGVRGSGYSHSLVFDMTLTDRLSYVVQSDMVSLDSSGANNNELGINQYLIYELNDRLSAGTRIEWWKSDNTGPSSSTYSVTSGLNFKPGENLRIRPEVRYNWGAPIVTAADMETPIFAIDFVLQF